MVSRKEFCEKYRVLAEQGKSAREIGRELGFEGDDKSVALKVSQKATLYRKQFKEFALQQAKEQGLKKAETDALVEETTALIPKLKTRTREADNLASFIAELKEKADAPSE